jgi:hypothetical protein
MSSNSSFTVLAGVTALALAGTAMANTNLDAGSTGDLFLNIVDTTNNTSFLFDTGIAQASFTGTSSLTPFNLASDPNYVAFKGAAGASDVLDYSVVSATLTNSSTTGTIFYTSALGTQTAQPGANISTSLTAASNFASQANTVSSTTTNSAYLPTANYWGQGSFEGIFATNLTSNGNGDNTAIGTAMAYYEQTSSKLSSASKLATLSTFAGTWDLTAAGILSYTVSSSTVPLPAPLMLLLSGLGLTGLLGRRGKSASTEPGAAAV